MITKMKRYLGAGILVTAPIGITLYLAWLVIDGVDNLVAELIPAKYLPEYSIPGLGFILVLIILILIGAFTAGYAGRVIKNISALVMKKMPVLNSVYNTLQQVFETVFSSKGNSFKEVVLIEYPMKGSWAVAFITSSTKGELEERLSDSEDHVNVFIPTTPNPTSGFLLFLPRDKVKKLDMTVEEGIKLIISFGIMTPMSSKEKLEAEIAKQKKKLSTKKRVKRTKKSPAKKK